MQPCDEQSAAELRAKPMHVRQLARYLANDDETVRRLGAFADELDTRAGVLEAAGKAMSDAVTVLAYPARQSSRRYT